jgi:transcriptional regulator with XRE-family HTH domain
VVGVPDVGVTNRDPHPAAGCSYSEGVTPTEPRPRDAVRAEIREFLSSRRARITPEQAGLPTYGGDRRRVPGLRREEAALLVGVSPQYYIRLERGDAIGVSQSVIDGIAHALRLDAAERAHLLDLLRTAGAPARARQRRSPATRRVRPTIQRLVDSIQVPAMVLTGHLDVLAMNSLGRALFSPLFAQRDQPNNARIVFLDPRATTFFREWEKVANDTVALLRAEAGRDPYDRDLSDLIGELSTRSEDFRVRWAAHDVRIHNTGVKKLHHDVVGDLDLPFESLPIETGSSTSLVTYLPEPDSSSHEALALLASWAGGHTDHARTTAEHDQPHLR